MFSKEEDTDLFFNANALSDYLERLRLAGKPPYPNMSS